MTNAIGMRLGRSKSSSGVVLAWERTALVIDDYRSAYRRDSTTDALAVRDVPVQERVSGQGQRLILPMPRPECDLWEIMRVGHRS